MARFSERYGYVEPRSVIQTDELDDVTRTALMNIVYAGPLAEIERSTSAIRSPVAVRLWNFWERPFGELERTVGRRVVGEVEAAFESGPFYEIMDLLEFFSTDGNDARAKALYKDLINDVFAMYLVGHRLIDGQIVRVTEAAEVEAIEDALEVTAPFSGARSHLRNALALLADRNDPKYAKVVHESISAVEAIARHYTEEKTLGGALKKLEAKGVPTHKALNGAWGQLFGYTSDGNGIRHGSVEDGDVDEALATYFLVTCSAFVGYLIKKGGERGEES